MGIRNNRNSILLECICYLLVILFVYAAVSKLLVFQDFKVQIGKSPMLTTFRDWLVWIVPLLEIGIALSLLSPRFKVLGLYASFGLMISFTTYIIIILKFVDHIPCSCGGILESLGWKEHLFFNSFFIFISFVGILIYSSRNKKKTLNYTS